MRRLFASLGIASSMVACTGSTPKPAGPEPEPSARGAATEQGHGRKVGGACTSDAVPGTGTVTRIEDDTTAGPDCKSAKQVTLSFVPDDAAATPHRLDPAFPLEVGGVAFVATGCVEEHHLALGTKLKVVRHLRTSGTCSPVTYEVTDFASPEAIEKCVAHCR